MRRHDTPFRSHARLYLAAITVLLLTLVAAPLGAYCRNTTQSPADESYDPSTTLECGEGKSALPLYWPTACVEYRVIVEPEIVRSGRLTLEEARDIVRRAAEAWTQAACARSLGGVRSPSITLVDVDEARCAGGPTGVAARVSNEIRFGGVSPDGARLARTSNAFDGLTGKIREGQIAVYASTVPLRSEAAAINSLDYVVRHELGHFLGLAHSEHRDAVMYASYAKQNTSGLTADDALAICEAYPPDAPVGQGCAVGHPFERAPAPPVFPLALALAVVARRLRCHRRSAHWTLLAAIVAGAFTVLSTTGLARAESTPPLAVAKAKPKKKPRLPPLVPDPDPEPLPITLAPAPAVLSAPERPIDKPRASPQLPRGTPDSRFWLGVRYRAFVFPAAFFGPFAKGGRTQLVHGAGVEGELRGSRVSILPALGYTYLGSGDMLLGQSSAKGVGYLAQVRSELHAVSATVDFMWPLWRPSSVVLELGFGFGVAALFGSVVDNWVFESENGELVLGSRRYSPCRTVNDGVGCRPQDHESAYPTRVGGHRDETWFAGGPIPGIFPVVSIPQVGLRFPVADRFSMRFGAGLSLTGLWIGVTVSDGVALP